jgi:glutaredoxin
MTSLCIYVLDSCPFCKKALDKLKKHRIKHVVHVVQPEDKDKYKKKHKHPTFPQLILKENGKKKLLGGSDDLTTKMIKILKKLK